MIFFKQNIHTLYIFVNISSQNTDEEVMAME